jgi:hypothetical protein
MISTYEKTQLQFKQGILTLKFCENVVVQVEDIINIYCYAIDQSRGKPFGILFDTNSKHEMTEEAIQHMVDSNYMNNIIGIAYVSKDLISKIRLSLLLIFERPKITPKLFSDEKEALLWLQKDVRENLFT